jgi:UDP-N-acetylglucosamine diphosphorylase/glucosamine-1-phosphate N-acetyltransferase
MDNLILIDNQEHWNALLPLTYTRPISELRVGIMTIRAKWEYLLDSKATYITESYLSSKYPFILEEDNLIINSTIIPTPYIIEQVKKLEINRAAVWNDTLIAARMDKNQFDSLQTDSDFEEIPGNNIASDNEQLLQILRPHDIFKLNGAALQLDFDLLTKNKISAPIPDHVQTINPKKIFLEEGAELSHCILNASTGPIYISKGANIMDGSIIRGPLAMLDGAVTKMGAKIYGPSTLGPFCKVGGEINNVVFQGFSSKAHDGFLGNSVIGEWCNLGADTNCSNLKNNYAEVKLYDYISQRFSPTGLQFCGLIMGDHSKCGINSMFNTGTVVGIGCNLFGSGFPRNFVPSFSWGGAKGFSTFKLEKMYDVAEKVMARRGTELTETDKKILGHIFYFSSKFRNWEN